ncbi:hypothetical protein JG687_00003966 [Phytophthora cactorum]|uniref:SWIM-type domain-containing protein n=1 Tax=Phytophthora cactorum TaxID=29920 RepID=A0A8T1UQ31_9STRA|nr:hypothetical protein JG687_00003966 [Phytophthora cactorum]
MATSEGCRLQVTWPTVGEPSCDCLFFSSTRLPCKHMCSVLETYIKWRKCPRSCASSSALVNEGSPASVTIGKFYNGASSEGQQIDDEGNTRA